MSGTVESPEWTDEDRAALLGLQRYEGTLCPGNCGQPRQIAWHADARGLADAEKFVCTACTARDGQERVFSVVTFTDDPKAPIRIADLAPLQLGVNTIEPKGGAGS